MTRRTILFSVLIAVAILGAANAVYLAFLAFAGEAPICNFLQGCDVVAASPYSRIAGVPLALFGVFFYLTAAGFGAWGLITPSRISLQLLLVVTALGFALSLYFLYLQAFVIRAFCEYCLFSLFDAAVLFVCALTLSRLSDSTGYAEETKTT
jgi:uncharacterized membrane protein